MKHELDEKLKKASDRHSAQLESVKQAAHESCVLKNSSPQKTEQKKVDEQ